MCLCVVFNGELTIVHDVLYLLNDCFAGRILKKLLHPGNSLLVMFEIRNIY